MNAIELLKSQHREVEKLFMKIEKASEDEKREVFEEIADALAAHATIEEKHFYPATNTARTEDMLLEAVEEHLGIKRFIADLLELEASDPSFDPKIKVLKEQVEHHVEEEEEHLFPKVETTFKADQLEDLGMIMEEHFDELQEGSPRESVPAETGAAAPID